MQTIKNYSQPKANHGEQKVIVDMAMTAETDELDLQAGQNDKEDTQDQDLPNH